MRFQLSYALPVLSALLGLWLFPMARHLTVRSEKARYYLLQLITMIGAIVGAKIAAMMGDLGWPVHMPPGGTLEAVRVVGRSITGGLLGGFAAAEAAKPLLNYRHPPNDRFAMILPLALAQGRLGCVLTGCCAGLPHEGALSWADHSGVHRWPTQLFELAFQLSIFALFVVLVRRKALPGKLFALYLLLYGCFRFATEFLRETPKWFAPFSAYQLIALFTALLGAALLAWRRTPPEPAALPALEPAPSSA